MAFNFFKPKEKVEIQELKEFNSSLLSLLNSDKYISRKMYQSLLDNCSSKYNELKIIQSNKVLNTYCNNNNLSEDKIKEFFYRFENIETLVNNHNDSFIEKHLIDDKHYLDNILKDDDPIISLDNEQRRVVLSDEDYTLVVAGAGAGKTTTIEAKVKYLVEKQNIDPDKILIISFTRKATQELRERINVKLKINANISTFHSIGYTIIKQEESRKNIVDNSFMFNTIRDYLKSKLTDDFFVNKLVLFFSSYLNIPQSFSSANLLFKHLEKNDFTTLKDDLKDELDNYQKSLVRSHYTINKEKCRSNEEVRIANFLYINGIDYQYEPLYRYCLPNTIKPYHPDFIIRQGDKEVYLEHFGISERGENNRFTQEELAAYKKHINDKVILHKKHNTHLIYTFSKYNDNRDVITHLSELLQKEGFELNRRNDEVIYKKLTETAEDRYFNRFIQFVCNFISKFKTNNFSMDKYDYWRINLNDERTKLFIDIAYQCHLAYSRALKDTNSIDFEDMINNASSILDSYINSNTKLPYDYIFVDEYQDISLQRFDLCERLSKCCDAKIIAVGDDWQSIYRFSGSNVGLFTQFENYLPYAKILKITNTYRNSQELIDIAGNFIMENHKQITKTLKSPKHNPHPVILKSFDDNSNKDDNGNGLYYRLCEAVENSIQDIVDEFGNKKSILLIGRYGFDCRNLVKVEDKFYIKNGKIISKKFPQVSLSSYTAHASKGLGFDNVIILNAKDDILGFPSKIIDDPIMQLVIKNDEDYIEYAEERRLFYVALTRTKNKVYIITPKNHPSKFILEIQNKFQSIILDGTPLTPIRELNLKRKCPHCSYPLQLRTSNIHNVSFNKLWICSNDPEICGFITNDLSGGPLSISKCPACEDGYLIVKKIKLENKVDTGQRMLGCTNYKADKKGCNYFMKPHNFTQDIEKAKSLIYSEVEPIENLKIFDKSVKKLVNVIINILDTTEKIVPNFKFSPYFLSHFLIGKESKPIIAFDLKRLLPNFAYINPKYEKKLLVFISSLKSYEIISINEQDHANIKLLTTNVSDEIITNLYIDFVNYRK